MIIHLKPTLIRATFFVAIMCTGIYIIHHNKDKKISKLTVKIQINSVKNKTKSKYILLWTDAKTTPFVYFAEGNTVFKKKNCEFNNCYVSSNRKILDDYTKFDIVAFNGPQLLQSLSNNDMPEHRSPHQKYVYTNIESVAWYPVCTQRFDGFFNWTWTYKLNSDAVWGYIAIKNSSGHVIGPSHHINWISLDDMEPIDNELKIKLMKKKRAAAWFVSNCRTISEREIFVERLKYFTELYQLKIDVYGSCGFLNCPIEKMDSCLKMLERYYYFYFAFENALSDDYVTEKILHALEHFTVPVVLGGANYSRFMPPGSYLNAGMLGPKELAKMMSKLIATPHLYQEYFKWRKYYSFHYRSESSETDDYCKFCAMANDEGLMKKTSVYDQFSSWWMPPGVCDTRGIF